MGERIYIVRGIWQDDYLNTAFIASMFYLSDAKLSRLVFQGCD